MWGMWFDVFLGAVAIVCGIGLQWIAEQRKWLRARKIARAELESGMGTDSPDKAMENAVVTINRGRIKRESKLLRLGSHSDGNGNGHKG